MPEYSPWPDNSFTYQTPHTEPVNSRRISDDPEFHSLRRAQRRFGTRATVLSVGVFLLYVLLSSFAPGVMNQPLLGRLTLGLALGLGQFAVMGVTAWYYVRHMRTKVDPLAHRLRAQRQRNETPRPDTVPQSPYNSARGFRTW